MSTDWVWEKIKDPTPRLYLPFQASYWPEASAHPSQNGGPGLEMKDMHHLGTKQIMLASVSIGRHARGMKWRG